MVRFSIFGVPVLVQPFFWITLAILGGAANANSATAIFEIMLFVLAGFISVLMHELGHALVARKFGAYSEITLQAFGGYAAYSGVRLTRPQSLAVTAAGPGAGFAFLVAMVAVLSLVFGSGDVIAFTQQVLFRYHASFRSNEFVHFLLEKPFVHLFIRHLLWINFWWGVINLLPVLPLDGGRIMELFVRPQKLVYQIGLVVALAMALYAHLVMGSLYTVCLFGFLAWQQWQALRANQWR